MTKQQKQKIVQYLNEAHGSELALVRQLQAQITMTPRGWGHTDSCPQRPARSDRRHGPGRDSVAVAVEP